MGLYLQFISAQVLLDFICVGGLKEDFFFNLVLPTLSGLGQQDCIFV